MSKHLPYIAVEQWLRRTVARPGLTVQPVSEREPLLDLRVVSPSAVSPSASQLHVQG